MIRPFLHAGGRGARADRGVVGRDSSTVELLRRTAWRQDHCPGTNLGRPVAAAYRESFEAFNRAHPDIEVRTDMVAYPTYFNTLRTDMAGGSADDIFWLSNAYFAAYADSGRLMDIGKTLGPDTAAGWEPAWWTSSPATGCCGASRN